MKKKDPTDEDVERSEALARLCISKYELDGELPSASIMSRMLFLETGLIINTTVLVRHLRQFGYTRFQRGWIKNDNS